MESRRNAIIGFVTVLIFGVALFYLAVARKPSATIRFSEAQLETNGSLTIRCDRTVSWGSAWRASLSRKEFVGGKKTGEGEWSGNGLTGSDIDTWHEQLELSAIPHPLPSVLVAKGRTYQLKLHDHLPIYNFTNNSGTVYYAEISLESSRK